LRRRREPDRGARDPAQRHRRGDCPGEVPGDAGERGPRARAVGAADPRAHQGAPRDESESLEGAEGALGLQEGIDAVGAVKALRYVARFIVMGAIIWWFLVVYATGRARRAFIRDREARRRSVAHWQGAVLRRALTALGAGFVKLGQVLSTRPDLLD